jgi:hypothetical protein
LLYGQRQARLGPSRIDALPDKLLALADEVIE